MRTSQTSIFVNVFAEKRLLLDPIEHFDSLTLDPPLHIWADELLDRYIWGVLNFRYPLKI